MNIDSRYGIGDPRRYNPSINTINKTMESFFDNVTNDILTARESGYADGFKTGFTKGFQLGYSDAEIKDIDYDSIKIFAKWCYVNGIDFSYMAKGTDTEPFTIRVINKFKKEMEDADGKEKL